MDFCTMELSLTVGSTVITTQLLKEELGLELNEVKEMAQKNLKNFCQQVSYKQFRKLLRKSKSPANVVVVRNNTS